MKIEKWKYCNQQGGPYNYEWFIFNRISIFPSNIQR